MYELATCRAENYLLKHRMSNCESTIEGLKQLVANITDKQLEIIGEMVEMRKKSIMPPKTITIDAWTSTIEDGVLDCIPNPESNDWNATSQATRVHSVFISPINSSDSDAEVEFAAPQVEYNMAINSMPSYNMLYTINEDIEPEDFPEDKD
ncbi:hypothetical protein KR200_006121 [Drosophila serrata]|nr:hypothetical protein KR200_006121 [Drosophila serrata]